MNCFQLYLVLFLTCWTFSSCGQPILDNNSGKEWSSGTLVFNGKQIESDRELAYYQRANLKFSVGEDDVELYVIDSEHWSLSQIFMHPLMGRLMSEELSANAYLLTGRINLPDEGNWQEDFVKHDAFELKLEFNDEGWRLYDFNPSILSLPVNENRLDSVRSILRNNAAAKSEDWDVALVTLELIEQYEYDLFTMALSGYSTALQEYLLLQKNYNIAYAGQFSEYFTGNVFYLLCRGLVTPQDLREARVYDDFPFLQRVYGAW